MKQLQDELNDANIVCKHCGMKYGRQIMLDHLFYWHYGICDLCRAKTKITRKKHFNNLRK